MKILVTNDDGIFAPGIQALATALSALGEVAIVAPDRERSAVSHALTLHHPLRAEEVSPLVYSVDGTPTDCVNIAIHALLPWRPDLVVSGINRGSNLGDDVTYSGTVSAAMEATLMGIPAFAVSLVTMGAGDNYLAAATVATRVAREIAANGLPLETLLNVNVPDMPLEMLLHPVVTLQGKRHYKGLIVDKIDPRGRKYYWIGSATPTIIDLEGSDHNAVAAGHVSITPLHLDLTNYSAIATIGEWNLS